MRYHPRLGFAATFVLAWMIGNGCQAQVHASNSAAKRPRNIILVICDQETGQLAARGDFPLPARQALMRHGVSFLNHYIASAMCSPSRAALLCGQPPQVTGVFDNMGCGYVPSLDPAMPNMGSVMKQLGYKTAYFGKFEMDAKLLVAEEGTDYRTALKPYGFDVFSAKGDIGSGPLEGYKSDSHIAAEGIRWLRASDAETRGQSDPFFMVLSFLNPHDIMYANANVSSQSQVQKAIAPRLLPPIPDNALYKKQWSFSLAPSLHESLTGPGMPPALAEYRKGWSSLLGLIPSDREDMWTRFYNYYLNCIRDNDRNLQEVINVMDEMNLWKDTVVILSSRPRRAGGRPRRPDGQGAVLLRGQRARAALDRASRCQTGHNVFGAHQSSRFVAHARRSGGR